MGGCARSGMHLYMLGFEETNENKNDHTSQFELLKNVKKNTNR